MKLTSQRKETQNAPTIVLFGGSPVRREEVKNHIMSIGKLTVIGTLSEEEGMLALQRLGEKVDLILIGGAYTIAQRNRIKAWARQHIPNVKISEPGFEFAYSNQSIVNDIKFKLNIATD